MAAHRRGSPDRTPGLLAPRTGASLQMVATRRRHDTRYPLCMLIRLDGVILLAAQIGPSGAVGLGSADARHGPAWVFAG